ncbi:Hypothetical predicted protein [Olea europaea subsp. europaea]|uniref:Uncharacterized protein n=1 Tax=Olea europaea subsp. europaea TaxID=158383 RepID=A0A8S0SLN5_OLEEU|nr:Hypothetical predicted protein [Olea europaea subsp. europaea]
MVTATHPLSETVVTQTTMTYLPLETGIVHTLSLLAFSHSGHHAERQLTATLNPLPEMSALTTEMHPLSKIVAHIFSSLSFSLSKYHVEHHLIDMLHLLSNMTAL